MEISITPHMKLLHKDGISGFLGFDREEVDFCQETLMIGYVNKLDEEGFASEFRIFNITDIEEALEKSNKEDDLIETYSIECTYEGMTTLGTESGIGTYPTYLLKSTKDSDQEVRLFIQIVTRE